MDDDQHLSYVTKLKNKNTLIKSFNLQFALCVAFGVGVCEYEEYQRALWECLVGFKLGKTRWLWFGICLLC